MKLETLGRKPIEQKSVGPLDIDLMLKRLGRRSNKRYIWDTIWECDENLDGRIDWDEMKLCFQRNASDETGLEHSKFYNLIQVRTRTRTRTRTRPARSPACRPTPPTHSPPLSNTPPTHHSPVSSRLLLVHDVRCE